MITHIRIKNFKSWKDSDKVEFAPLTGFFGTNSSGKSSLLQMLLLLKQTAERSKAEEGSVVEDTIFFGDENSLVNLGNFCEVIHGHKEEEPLELEFGCELREPHSIDFSVKGQDSRKLKISNFTFNTVIKEEYGQPTVQNIRYANSSDSWTIEWKKDPSDNERLDGRQFINGTLLGDAEVQSCYGTPMSTRWRGPQIKWERKFLKHISLVFESLFAYVYYLEATRVQPKRIYHWEGTHPDSIGQSGEDMIASLLNARVDQRTTPYEGQNVPIEERISWWLREMDLAYSFSIKRTTTGKDRDYEVLIQKGPDGAKVTLADMGYGLSQFLPVLVHCYYAPEGSTLILEQPGMHLHPRAQANLADLLIEVITERNLQILVESHSEHLLTRLQLRIAEGKIPASDTALYFCENENGVSTIKSLDVDELGNIKNWPKNFFGNVRGDLVKMAREQMKRQKKAEDE